MIFIGELAGYLMIKYRSADKPFAEYLLDRFPGAALKIMLVDLYEGCYDKFWRATYYQTLSHKTLDDQINYFKNDSTTTSLHK